MRIIEVAEVTPEHADGRTFSVELPRPNGALLGLLIQQQGTTVGTTAIADDSVERLVSNFAVEIPTRRGNVVAQAPMRDHLLLGLYAGAIYERTIPAAAAAYNSTFMLPFGWPPEVMESDHLWGFSRESIVGPLQVSGQWANAVEYGANTSAITNGRIIISYVLDDVPGGNRLALIGTANTYAVESASEFTEKPVNFARGSVGCFGVIFRQEDDSAAADRVDGLVTKYQLDHSLGRVLLRGNAFALRGPGVRWSKIDRAYAVTASPEGLDGTVFYVANRRLLRNQYPPLGGNASISLAFDAQSPVRNGQTNVAPASGDKLHAYAIGIVPG